MLKVDDKVRLVKVNGDDHMALRYDVPIGTVGTVTYVNHTDEWMFVDWGVEGEAAMRMWPEELVLA